MRDSIFKLMLVGFLLVSSSLIAQTDLLQSGPKVAYSTMKEVLLWAQTSESAKVHFVYWNINTPSNRMKSEEVVTSKDKAYVAHVIAAVLEPGNAYNYELYINNRKVERPYNLRFETQALWQWRKDAPDFSFATGSCAYISDAPYDRPGEPYGGDYQIFEDIYKKEPQFFLWLGDNVYLREADWNSKTGIHYRYTHTHSNPEMQPMLGSMHHYSIWDDHDYGPNDSDRAYPMKQVTLETFRNFYPNPNYIFDEGITGFFQWADCDFFLLDNRTWRTPNNRSDIADHVILGEEQIQWLFDALVNSQAPFKFVVMGGQFINPIKSFEKYNNIAPKERNYIIETIEKLKIEGVIFITGDVHYTELSRLDMHGAYPLYDLTVSPLTSGVAGDGAEKNPNQVEGTLVKERTYAKIDVRGPRNERKLSITIYNSNGEEKWTYDIEEQQLRFKSVTD